MADGLTKSLLGQAFHKFKRQLGVGKVIKCDELDKRKPQVSRLVVGAVAAAAAVLCLLGKPEAAGMVALCALALEKRRSAQEAKRRSQDPKEGVELAQKASALQDGRRATSRDQDGMEATSKDGRPGTGTATDKDGGKA